MGAVVKLKYLPELSLISKNAGTNEQVKQNLDISILNDKIYFPADENTYISYFSFGMFRYFRTYVDNTLTQEIVKDNISNETSVKFFGSLNLKNTLSIRKSLVSVDTSTDISLDSQSDNVIFSYFRNGQPAPYEFMRFIWNSTYLNSYLDLNVPVRIEDRTADPPINVEGTLYWNSTHKNLRVFDGSGWIDVGSGSGGSVGDTIETGNLRNQIIRTNTLPVTGASPSWYNKLGSVSIVDEEDADQSRGLNIFSRGGIPNITLGRFESDASLYSPGTTPNATTVGRLVFVGANNNLYSDFGRITAVKQGATNNICWGNIEIGVRNANGTYINPIVINSSGHLRVSTGSTPTVTPGSDSVILGNGTCWIGDKLRVEGQVGYVEAANRSDGNGTTLKVNSTTYKYAQLQLLWDGSQRAAIEIDSTYGQLGIVGGWDSGSYISMRVGSGLPEVARVYADRFVVGHNTEAALVLKNRTALPSSPETGMLVNHNDQLKFFNGSSWVTIA